MIETILDSGDRREFGTGAVRDMAGKGRCDLLPWGVIAGVYREDAPTRIICECMEDAVHHNDMMRTIYSALIEFISLAYRESFETAMLEVAYHFEAGAKKYSDRNWENGIPVDAFLDSAGRHFLKYLRGDGDEQHNRAVVWNLLCAIWTIQNKPDMIDAPIGGAK